MGSKGEKDALFEAIALMGKAFASPRRLELLDLLAQAPRTVDELARASGQSTANTSQHLQALHDELLRLCRAHVDTEHPEMQRSDEQIRQRITADAYDAATV